MSRLDRKTSTGRHRSVLTSQSGQLRTHRRRCRMRRDRLAGRWTFRANLHRETYKKRSNGHARRTTSEKFQVHANWQARAILFARTGRHCSVQFSRVHDGHFYIACSSSCAVNPGVVRQIAIPPSSQGIDTLQHSQVTKARSGQSRAHFAVGCIASEPLREYGERVQTPWNGLNGSQRSRRQGGVPSRSHVHIHLLSVSRSNSSLMASTSRSTISSPPAEMAPDEEASPQCGPDDAQPKGCASAAPLTLTNEPAVIDPGTLIVWVCVQCLLDKFEFFTLR